MLIVELKAKEVSKIVEKGRFLKKELNNLNNNMISGKIQLEEASEDDIEFFFN